MGKYVSTIPADQKSAIQKANGAKRHTLESQAKSVARRLAEGEPLSPDVAATLRALLAPAEGRR